MLVICSCNFAQFDSGGFISNLATILGLWDGEEVEGLSQNVIELVCWWEFGFFFFFFK